MATPEQIAHLLRRTGFAIQPGQLQSLASEDIHDLIDQRLEDEGWALSEAEANARDLEDVRYDTLPTEWMNRIMSPAAGLHERMVWFWHNHFTTNRNETTYRHLWRQHHLVRRHALGNLRDLTRDIIVDGAMLHFLDGDGSIGEAPNENFSREFMELFVLGRNAGYTEQDVRAGARILSGWSVEYETAEVIFESDRHYSRPVEFLGERRQWTLDDYVDTVLTQPSAAGYIAGKIHSYLTSMPLSDERRGELADVLSGNDWEIRPLLSEILHHDDFTDAQGRRTRQPVEWLAGAATAFDVDAVGEDGFEFWQLSASGQTPFEPPNAAGWVDDERWSSPSQVIGRGNTVMHWDIGDRLINSIEPSPEAVLEHCGIPVASDATLNAMRRALDAQTEYDRGLELLLTLAVLSPEFATI